MTEGRIISCIRELEALLTSGSSSAEERVVLSDLIDEMYRVLFCIAESNYRENLKDLENINKQIENSDYDNIEAGKNKKFLKPKGFYCP